MKKLFLVAVGVCCVCAVSCRRAPEKQEKPPPAASTMATNAFVRIATVLGTADAENGVRQALEKQGIPCKINTGGPVYSVEVPPASKAKAIEALKALSAEYAVPVMFE